MTRTVTEQLTDTCQQNGLSQCIEVCDEENKCCPRQHSDTELILPLLNVQQKGNAYMLSSNVSRPAYYKTGFRGADDQPKRERSACQHSPAKLRWL